MYCAHYNLRERPFEISTDTRFLWMGEKHKEALAMLKYGVLARKGFLLLTGDVGTGKTTLVNALVQSLNEGTLVANITDPLLEPLDFFNFMAAAFGMGERFDNKVDFLIRFAAFLRKKSDEGRNVLLILDEAHRFSTELLEQFRLLSNIELPERKLINMFLVGQNEFNRTLMSADCRALRQRITLTYNIQPLSESETLQYVRYRLQVAGTEEEIFTRKAVAEVYRFSRGYPRLINILCDHALLTGYVKQLRKITPSVIQECSQELCLIGDTIRISSSDFFEAPEAQSAPSSPLRPPAETPVHGRTGPAREEPERPGAAPPLPKGRIDREPSDGAPPPQEPGERASGAGGNRPRYWVMAALIPVLVLCSALLLRKDLSLGTGEGDRNRSASAAPAVEVGETNPANSPAVEPETVTLVPEKPLAAVRPDGQTAFAKRSPYEQALREIEGGNLDRALEVLEEAIAATPADLPKLRLLYAEALRRQAAEVSHQDRDRAERLLAKAVESDPTNKQAYFDLGMHQTKAGRYPEAIQAYRKAADLDSRSAETFFNLGFAYAANGDYGNAEKMFLRAAALQPSYLDKALFNLAAVQQKQGKREACIASLEEALAVNPRNQRARTLLNQINSEPGGSP